jgi:hypothetical protein
MLVYALICLCTVGFIHALFSSRTVETIVYGAGLSILILILNIIKDEE